MTNMKMGTEKDTDIPLLKVQLKRNMKPQGNLKMKIKGEHEDGDATMIDGGDENEGGNDNEHDTAAESGVADGDEGWRYM